MSVIYPFHPQPYGGHILRDTSHRTLRETTACYNSAIDDPLDQERQHRQDLQRIQNFRLIDDDFMSAVFEDRACAELLLRVIMAREDLAVRTVKCQNWIQNLQGRSARLDILATDTRGGIHNIEVQRADAGADALRARYHSSLIDANITEPGDRYQHLGETSVIFITENDILGAGLPIYHIRRTIEETGTRFADRTQIIYVNSQIRDAGTALGRLMHDFWCVSHEDMHYPILADRVRHFKTNKEGQIYMCKALEQMRDEVAKAKSIQFADRLLNRHRDTYEEIAELTGLTLQEVQDLAARRPA